MVVLPDRPTKNTSPSLEAPGESVPPVTAVPELALVLIADPAMGVVVLLPDN